jgi:predicted PurR-regulated permease PerM
VVWGSVAIVAAWFLRDVLVLVFASILLAVLLRGAAVRLRRYTRLPTGASLALVLALIIGAFAVLATWQGPRVTEEVKILRRELPVAFEVLKARVTGNEAAQRLIDELPSRDEMVGDGAEIVAHAQSAAATTLGALAAVGLWLFIAVLLAVAPRTYVGGVIAVVPKRYERRVRRLMGELSSTLWWWSLGRLVSMTFVGVATGVGLALLGIPLAFLLGLIGALLTFVPNIGPLLAVVPAVLLALADDPIKALWVAALYAGIQAVEGLLLDPIIDRKTVHLPPALTVTMQIVMGLLAGLAGVALAAPLTAAGMVVVSVLWVARRSRQTGHALSEDDAPLKWPVEFVRPSIHRASRRSVGARR